MESIRDIILSAGWAYGRRRDRRRCIKRELKEELNLEIYPLEKIATTEGDVKDQVTHWWKCSIISGQIKKKNTEIADVGFFTKEQITSMKVWPATLLFFEKHI